MLYILYYTLLFLSIWKTAYAPYIPDEKYFEWVRQKEEIEQGKSYYESQRKHICLDCMIACMSMNEDLLNDPAWANKLDDLKENMEIAQNLGPERVNPLIDLIVSTKFNSCLLYLAREYPLNRGCSFPERSKIQRRALLSRHVHQDPAECIAEHMA